MTPLPLSKQPATGMLPYYHPYERRCETLSVPKSVAIVRAHRSRLPMTVAARAGSCRDPKDGRLELSLSVVSADQDFFCIEYLDKKAAHLGM